MYSFHIYTDSWESKLILAGSLSDTWQYHNNIMQFVWPSGSSNLWIYSCGLWFLTPSNIITYYSILSDLQAQIILLTLDNIHRQYHNTFFNLYDRPISYCHSDIYHWHSLSVMHTLDCEGYICHQHSDAVAQLTYELWAWLFEYQERNCMQARQFEFTCGLSNLKIAFRHKWNIE